MSRLELGKEAVALLTLYEEGVKSLAIVDTLRSARQEQYRKHRMPWFLLQTRLQVRVIESAQLGMLPMPIPELLKEAVAVQPLNLNGIAHSSSSINSFLLFE
uniref:Uncharacterized mitochondrial protein AtMg00260 n=1 Tax=Arabidopsis thaliana TaxID=3702 RepID=M260_ARATH|nr:RecName: Full=Uncharacterized mitochondrial protein AtMg00260; AltName: Full=ORF101a [Arabidopsis thaliana]CAA69768.1 unnamed protein product [Arabidopsis thaliana]